MTSQGCGLAAHQRLFPSPGRQPLPDFEIAGMMPPARGVGGDYYGLTFPSTRTRIQVVIADVAGKGVSGCPP